MQLAEADAVFALGDDRDIKGRKGLPLHRRANDADRFVFVPVIYLEKQLIVNLQDRADIRIVLELSDQLFMLHRSAKLRLPQSARLLMFGR